jgi:hypothetical protein
MRHLIPNRDAMRKSPFDAGAGTPDVSAFALPTTPSTPAPISSAAVASPVTHDIAIYCIVRPLESAAARQLIVFPLSSKVGFTVMSYV